MSFFILLHKYDTTWTYIKRLQFTTFYTVNVTVKCVQTFDWSSAESDGSSFRL